MPDEFKIVLLRPRYGWLLRSKPGRLHPILHLPLSFWVASANTFKNYLMDIARERVFVRVRAYWRTSIYPHIKGFTTHRKYYGDGSIYTGLISRFTVNI